MSRRRSSITKKVRHSSEVTRSKVRKEVGDCGLLQEREGKEGKGGKKNLVSRGVSKKEFGFPRG